MKSIVTFSLLILVTSMVLGGMTSTVSAQDDPAILLKLAKRAQNQIENQISSDSPEKIKRLFAEGINQVNALEKAIRNNDIDSAKEHFLSAMKIFTEISRSSPSPDVATKESASDVASSKVDSARQNVKDPSNDIQRLQVYLNSLKTIAKKYNASIDFTPLDELFSLSREQISNKQFALALETLQKIKETIVEINKELREEASKKESQRAKEYAQQYLEQLDRLIENAKKQGVSDEIIKKLEKAKENLSSADNPSEIVKQIKEIISIKDQFELTKNDRLESRVLQVEKSLLRLSQIDGVDPNDLADAKNTLQSIKRSLSNGEIDTASDLLRSLAKQLEEIKNSL
ncbi:MAG: hypothetical protein HKM23_01415 [Nitrosopumilus sp.]|nr:hypothetical protein [Nitrosopumilus sp.]NNL59359.1 hypothetical protein [Nitrosopumilus sp.]